MKCFTHSDVEAIATCATCGKAICQVCAVDVGGKMVCQQCVASGSANQLMRPPVKETNMLALASLGCSIIDIMFCLCSPALLPLFGIPAAIMGYVARKQLLRADNTKKGHELAMIGMILGAGQIKLPRTTNHILPEMS